MAGPITWQNVNGPSLAEAMRPMEAAQASINGSFNILQNVLKQRQATVDGNWEVQKTNNTQAYLDEVARAKTVDEFRALQQSGKLDTLATDFGGQIDRTAIRNAMDGRLPALMQRGTADIAYKNAQENEASRPFLNAYSAALYSGDKAAQDDLLTKFPNESARAKALENRFNLNRVVAADGRAVADQGMQVAAHNSALQTAAAQRENLFAEAGKKRAETGAGNLVSSVVREFEQTKANRNQFIKDLGAQRNLPLDANGFPDLQKATPAQLQDYTATIKQAGFAEEPSTSRALAKIDQGLVDSAVSPDTQTRLRAEANKLLHPGGSQSLADSEAQKAANAAAKVRKDNFEKTNPFAVGSPEQLITEKTKVLGDLNKEIKDWGPTKRSIMNTANTWMDGGFPYTQADGTTKNIAIPPKLLTQALALGMERDAWFFTGNSTDTKTQAILQKMISSPEYRKLQKEADDYEAGALGEQRLKNSLKYNPNTGGGDAYEGAIRELKLRQQEATRGAVGKSVR